jgi:Subtilase family/CARDB
MIRQARRITYGLSIRLRRVSNNRSISSRRQALGPSQPCKTMQRVILIVWLFVLTVVPIAWMDEVIAADPNVPPSRRFTFQIDPGIQPSVRALPGIRGGPLRPVAVTIGPDGKRDEYVSNEVIFHPSNEADLQSFLAQYGGVVLHDGTPMLITEAGAAPGPPETSSGDYLIRVDLRLSSLSDLEGNMTAFGITGLHLFSSDDGARLVSLLTRETPGRRVSPNMVATPHCTICEHPDGLGGNIDFATFPWMIEDDNPSAPGDQGLSIGVLRAWEYLAYMGLPPPFGGGFVPSIIAIIDQGFALDTTTGEGNLDYIFRPRQADVIDHDGTAGGPCASDGCTDKWHGQGAFGVAAAEPRNGFGSAGTGGEVVLPMLIRFDGSYQGMADAVRTANLSGADVINISWGGECNWLCNAFSGFDESGVDNLQSELLFAAANGAINCVSAGNGNDAGIGIPANIIPCKLNGVICVGAIAENGQARSYSNFGPNVDIWAPDCVRTTVTPDTAAAVGLAALPEFCGTSAASPFVAGIVGLMKALDRSISGAEALQILQTTNNSAFNTGGTIHDSKVTQGWVDAFKAVMAVRPNQPPTVEVTLGPSLFPRSPSIRAAVHDPEPGGAVPGAVVVRFSSNRDGELCVDRTSSTLFSCNAPRLSLGTHVITATATDPFGGQGSASLTLSISNLLPTATITSPVGDIQVTTSQFVHFHGVGQDPDGPVFLSSMEWVASDLGRIGVGDDIIVRLPVGQHFVTFAVTDADGATATDTVVVTVVRDEGQPGIDLVPVRVVCTLQSNPILHRLAITVANQGNIDAPASLTRVTFPSLRVSTLRTPPIGAGQIVNLPLATFSLPVGQEIVNFIVTADGTNLINETNETNNTATGQCPRITE